MSAITKLILLDYYTMRAQLKSFLILLAVAVYFFFIGAQITLVCITCTWYMALMAINIFAIQEKDHLERLYGTLPVTGNQVVLGRYLFIIGSFLIACLAMAALHLLFVAIGRVTLDLPGLLMGVAIGLASFSVVLGIQMPLFFRMGYTRARYWSLLPFMAMMVIPLALSSRIKWLQLLEVDLDSVQILVICLAVALVVNVISYRVSLVCWRKNR